ncbi:tripartite motif-containing protein 64-like [Oryctolagus cuniculus]|uniref:tripartite motif-containing protein 64-like n=1 Tax=Oryctolagus cuniculus TaxID=9986 RepID=UPI0038795FB7
MEAKPREPSRRVYAPVMEGESHGSRLQVFQRELTCPIGMNFFLDPVMIDCGHNFCRSCLSLSWEEAETPMCCPMCKEMSEKTNFKTNVVLKKLASTARQDQLNQVTRLQEQVPVAQTEAAGLLHEVYKRLHCQPLIQNYYYQKKKTEGKTLVFSILFPQPLPFPISKGVTYIRTYSMLLNLIIILQEKLLKEMNTLWELIQELKNNVTEEIKKTHSFKMYSLFPNYSIPTHSQRAESFAVWGAQTFTSGKYHWEVDMSSSSSWILGVCYDSSTSDTSNIIHFEEAFLLASLKSNNHYVLSTSVPPLTHYVKRPLSMVGLFLDCDHGTVGFYDVDKGSLIHCNVPTQFTSPLNPFFCLGPL